MIVLYKLKEKKLLTIFLKVRSNKNFKKIKLDKKCHDRNGESPNLEFARLYICSQTNHTQFCWAWFRKNLTKLCHDRAVTELKEFVKCTQVKRSFAYVEIERKCMFINTIVRTQKLKRTVTNPAWNTRAAQIHYNMIHVTSESCMHQTLERLCHRDYPIDGERVCVHHFSICP